MILTSYCFSYHLFAPAFAFDMSVVFALSRPAALMNPSISLLDRYAQALWQHQVLVIRPSVSLPIWSSIRSPIQISFVTGRSLRFEDSAITETCRKTARSASHLSSAVPSTLIPNYTNTDEEPGRGLKAEGHPLLRECRDDLCEQFPSIKSLSPKI